MQTAARKLVEIVNSVEAVQDDRIFIELINWPFLHDLKGTPQEYGAGLDLAIERGWTPAARVRHLCEVHPGRRGAVCLMKCTVCEDCGWVCEDGAHACTCGGVGMPAINAIRAIVGGISGARIGVREMPRVVETLAGTLRSPSNGAGGHNCYGFFQ